jgi:hypothetical protein
MDPALKEVGLDKLFDYLAGPSGSELIDYDDTRPRTAKIKLGPSDVGRCLRQAGYRHHGVAPSDYRSNRLARLGTLLHLGYATLAQREGLRTEVPVGFDTGLSGTADVVDDDTHTVTDLKTTSRRGYTRALTYGPYESQWDQLEVYAYGLGFECGVFDWTLRLVLINRETGEEATFARPADAERGAQLVEELDHRQTQLDTSTSPDELPREGSGPGRGMPCDWCEWCTACWGVGQNGRSPQAELIVDDPEKVADTLETYLDAGAAEREAGKVKGDARAYLTGLPAGDYRGLRLDWRGGGEQPARPDADAMAAALIAAGMEVPYTKPESRRSIAVSRVAPADPG